MKLFITRYKAYLLLALILIICELIVNPLGDFPLNDDWTYTKSLVNLVQHNTYNIGTSSSTLLTHLMYGFLFVKVFGFSFMILRISTLISSLIGILLVFKLVNQITHNKSMALLAALTLLFNPIYFNLSNTYMTDINFNTLLIACCYFGFQFYTSLKTKHFVLFFVCSLLLILIRQFGLIIPFSFMMACLFLKENKWRYSVLALLAFILVVFVFKLYEGYLQQAQAVDAGYPFASKIAFFELEFWTKTWLTFKLRISTILIYPIVFSFPFVVVYFISIIKNVPKWLVFAIIAFSILITFTTFSNTLFLLGNIFTNMQLGAETFYENLNPSNRISHSFTEDPYFAQGLNIIKYVSATVFIATLFVMLYLRIKTKQVFQLNPLFVWTSVGLISYIFLLIISDMYFDRYHLPLISVFILMSAYLYRSYTTNPKFSWIFLLPLFYISVFGTKDYFSLNNTKWEAYRFLRNEQKISIDKINAGYEVNCWYDGKPSIYWASFFLDEYSHLIQHRKEPGFELMREYEFQRYFPFKKDKIYIFVRQEKKAGL